MDSLPMWLLLTLFVASAGVIWGAGILLSETTDTLDSRLHLGSAFGGLIVLAVATNLPEVAITVSAALAGNVDIAVGNILGGIAIQTVVIAVLDLFGKRAPDAKPLTYRAASLTLVLEALVVVAVLTVVVAGSQLPANLVVARMTPDVILIAILWVIGLLLVQRAGRGLPWHPGGEAPDATRTRKGIARVTEATHRRRKLQDRRRHQSPPPVHPPYRCPVRSSCRGHAGRRRDTREVGRGGVLTDRAHRRPFRSHCAGPGDLAARDLHRPSGGPSGRRQPRDQ